MSFAIVSDCICCFNCPKHEVNTRHGYIIPCKEKNTCESYIALLEEHKAARNLERQDAIARMQEYESRDYRFRKIQHK